jgi:cytochrome c biogenesis protein CcmG/thiol:disulfide interchange protein DsbE
VTETDSQLPPPLPVQPRRRRWLTLVPLVVFVALAVVFGLRINEIRNNEDTSFIPSALIGAPAPQFDLPALAGLDGVPGLRREDLLGKVTLVNVWASWCVPCRLEHPVLEALAKDGRFGLVGINHKDQPASGLRFLNEFGNPFQAVGVDLNGRVSIDWGVYGVPETFLVGPDGVIRYKVVGPLTDERVRKELMPEIEKVLAGQPA